MRPFDPIHDVEHIPFRRAWLCPDHLGPLVGTARNVDEPAPQLGIGPEQHLLLVQRQAPEILPDLPVVERGGGLEGQDRVDLAAMDLGEETSPGQIFFLDDLV